MPRKPGHPRTGGREPGAKNLFPNAMRLDLIQVLRGKGFDPAFELVRVSEEAWIAYQEAHPDYKALYLKIALDAAKHLMEFLYPKRKSIELAPGEGGKDFFQSFTELIKHMASEKSE